MNIEKDKYIIIEVIPTYSKKEKGMIAQLSALKLEGLKLVDRFDYRLKDELIENKDLKEVIQYDKKSFTYVDNPHFIPEKFKSWAKDLPLLIIEDTYTLDYLEELKNPKELIYPYLNMTHSYNVFNKIIEKYHLKPSNHLVDLLYEALIYESNNKEQNKKSEREEKS